MSYLRPRPGIRFTPILDWLDERGYRLSDRIWNVSETTIARIDALLTEGITTGRSAVDIADDLEEFLLPERRGIVTRRPYGTVGSYDARRLARSEITRANSVAFRECSRRNPFVTRIHHRLSSSHNPARCNGTCDDLAREDVERGGWPVDEAPTLIDDTHPHCLCTQYAEAADPEGTLEQLRAELSRGNIEDRHTRQVTPLEIDLLVGILLGRILEHITSADAERQSAV